MAGAAAPAAIAAAVRSTARALPLASWDGLAEQVNEYAREHTPLPMTGATPNWSDGTPADALRRAGLTYTARAQAR